MILEQSDSFARWSTQSGRMYRKFPDRVKTY